MTNDPTRTPDPAHPGQPSPAQPIQPAPTQPLPDVEPWYATPGPTMPGSAGAPSFIPAGIGAKPAPAKASKQGGLLTGALLVAALIAALGVGFAAGRVTSPQQTTTGRGQGSGNGNGSGTPNASGRPGNGFGGVAAGSIEVSGSVVALGDGTITVQPAGGSGTVQIAVPSTTTYHSQGSASSTDLAIGSQVEVTVNRPQFRGGADASGAPGASANPGTGTGGANGANAALTATDILLTGK